MSKRLLSVDVFRAITMLLMIFVNDVGGVHHIPAWIDHAEAGQDRLGFADTIFPAFLFIVGLSLPLALRQREQNGNSTVSILWYIISRSAALIIMGFYHVNGESYSHEAVLPHSVWTILTTVAFFLIWLYYPPSFSKQGKNALKGIGIAILISMAMLYKGGNEDEVHGMEMSWWGILGIIGWAYLACSILYVLLYGKLKWLLGALLVLLVINIATHTGLLLFRINIIGDASSAALVMAGVVTTLAYGQLVTANKRPTTGAILLIAAAFSIIAGFVVRPFAGGISKIYATPAWVFICAGISLLAYLFFIWLVEVQGKYHWFSFIKPAGTSTLTCYLLPYILYSLMSLFHVWYPVFLSNGLPGICRSFAVAFIVIAVAGALEKRGIRLKI